MPASITANQSHDGVATVSPYTPSAVRKTPENPANPNPGCVISNAMHASPNTNRK